MKRRHGAAGLVGRWIAAVALTLALTVALIVAWPASGEGARAASPYTICIDPGHGGTDPGAVGCGLQEKDVVLSVGLKLRQILEADADFTPIMTRDTDVFIPLSGRTSYANDNGADRFASIHNNSFDGTATGIETYCWGSGSAASFDQRDKIQAEMLSIWPLADRGGKTANFYVIKYTSMPATLSELAFLDNCALDATYLADPAEQQRAAEAHHQALRASLGLGSTPPVDLDGDLRGVVFEDLGVGTADMSVRLPGANVTVRDGQGAWVDSQAATAPDASWAFTLSPGTYEVEASASGHETTSRWCDVVAGETTWCSVGLAVEVTPVSEPGPEPGPEPAPEPLAELAPEPGPEPVAELAPEPGPEPSPEPVAELAPEPGPEFGPELGPEPTPEPVPDLAQADAGPLDSGPLDAGSADAGAQTDQGPLLFDAGAVGGAAETGAAQPGCAGAPAPGDAAPAALALALLGLVALARRWRGGRRASRRKESLASSLAAVLLLAAGVVTADVGHAAPPEGAWAVTGLTAWTQAGDYAAPVLSPGDGGTSPTLVFTTSHLDRLLVKDAPDTPAREVAQGRRVGYVPTWSPRGEAVWYRTPGQRSADVPALAVGADGAPSPPPWNRTPGLWVRVVDDAIWLRQGRVERRISPPGDRYCCARVSPDGARVAFLGLATGLYLYDVATGTRAALGRGAHPRFAGDGRRLVFDRSTDDGQRLVTSVLVVADWGVPAGRPRLHVLTGTPPLAARPSLSFDGHTVAFDAGGAIWVGRIP